MTDDTFEHERLEAALRRELRGQSVPFDRTLADEMIFVATTAETRRPLRMVAPLGTAAAVLAVGAGVAVFAANGTGGAGPAPAGGPTPAPTVKPREVCVTLRHDRATATPIPQLTPRQQARLARRKQQLAHEQMRAELRKARHERAVAPGSTPPKPLPAHISARPAPLPATSIANLKCRAAIRFACHHSSRPQTCVALMRPGPGTLQPIGPRTSKGTSVATVRPPLQTRARVRVTRSPAIYTPPPPTGPAASPSCTEPPNMPACPSPR